MVFCKLPVGPDRPQLPENCCRESLGNCLHASVCQPSRLANMKGKPTKRIVRTLTTESSGAKRLTYEKELLNSRKNSNFYKTNPLASLMLFPPSLATLRLEPVLWRCRIRAHHINPRFNRGPVRPTTNQVLSPRIIALHPPVGLWYIER